MIQSDRLNVKSGQIYKVIYTVIISICVLIWISPILLTVLTSIKTNNAILTDPFSLPKTPIFQPYVTAWQTLEYNKLVVNSIIYSFAGTALAIVLAIFPAYVFTKFYVPASSVLFTILLVALVLPQQTFIIPLYDIIKNLKLLDTRLGMIIVHGIFGMPFELIILSGFLSNIPDELQDAARIDGCSNLGVLRYILVPLLNPAIAVGFVVNFINIWKEYFFALIFLNSRPLLPMTVGIVEATSDKYSSSWNVPAAAVIVAQIPLFIIFIFAYRWIKEGIFTGAVKG